jgi:cation diffusion facilitator CzcD-associated flavoprotein CzcO
MGSMASPKDAPSSTSLDVIIVGAGISGINAAYRVKTELPGHTYTILDARGALGGTWDFFRYPGIRSDSDLHTFGFPWRAWKAQSPIATAPEILKYLNETAKEEGIDRKIQFHHKMLSANWSSDQQAWQLEVDANGERKYFHSRFLILGTGYYSYDQGLQAEIPGLDTFKGPIAHPQFWPEDLDFKDKNIAIIGSGATAVTLLPALAKEGARHVTMVQRSPGYFVSLPQSDPITYYAAKFLPAWMAQRLNRIRFMTFAWLLFQWCRHFPNAAKNVLRKGTLAQLPKNIPYDPHFEPKYNPWEQRMCICPDGDFFKPLREGKADIATGHIETVTEHGITLKSGQKLDADIIVTATGLKVQIAGGAKISVDGSPIKINEKYIWKGTMLEDVPNAAFIIGYTNASWTLGADAAAQLIIRLLKNMEKAKQTSAVPKLENPDVLKPTPFLNLTSTYLQKAESVFPKSGDQAPWKARTNYFQDLYTAKYGDIKHGLQFSRASVE